MSGEQQRGAGRNQAQAQVRTEEHTAGSQLQSLVQVGPSARSSSEELTGHAGRRQLSHEWRTAARSRVKPDAGATQDR